MVVGCGGQKLKNKTEPDWSAGRDGACLGGEPVRLVYTGSRCLLTQPGEGHGSAGAGTATGAGAERKKLPVARRLVAAGGALGPRRGCDGLEGSRLET